MTCDFCEKDFSEGYVFECEDIQIENAECYAIRFCCFLCAGQGIMAPILERFAISSGFNISANEIQHYVEESANKLFGEEK